MDINIKVDRSGFYAMKKDSYTFDEVNQILDDAFKSTNSKLEVQSKKITEQVNTEINNKLKAFDLLDSQKKELDAQIQKYLADIKTKDESITKLQNQIKPLQESHYDQLSKKILKDLVIDGAERDTFNLIKDDDEFKKINFESENWKDNLQPILTNIFKTKPYLKAVVKKDSKNPTTKPSLNKPNQFIEKFDKETPVNKEFNEILEKGKKENFIDTEHEIIM